MDFLKIGSKERLAEGRRKIKFKYIGFVEAIILIAIALTSLSVLYVTVPIFLSVIFMLIQLKKFIAYRINRPYPVKEEIKENG